VNSATARVIDFKPPAGIGEKIANKLLGLPEEPDEPADRNYLAATVIFVLLIMVLFWLTDLRKSRVKGYSC